MNYEEIVGRNLSGRVFQMEEGEHIYYVAPSPDNEYIAAVFGNGCLKIMEPRTMETLGRTMPGKPYDDLPCTCVRWFPTTTMEDNAKEYRLISVSSAGGIFGWKWDGTNLIRYKRAEEKGNEPAVVDICPSEEFFLTAGKDRLVRLYDSSTFKVVQELKKGVDETGGTRPTHISRVFSVRFLTKTLAASAGWESPVQLWDLRTFRSDRQILGTQGSADCLEPISDTNIVVLTSSKGSSKIRLLDVIRGTEMEEENARLNVNLTTSENPVVSRFSPKSNNIWAICCSPHKLIVVGFSSGQIVAELMLPSAPLNLMLIERDSVYAYVPCQDGNLVLATLS